MQALIKKIAGNYLALVSASNSDIGKIVYYDNFKAKAVLESVWYSGYGITGEPQIISSCWVSLGDTSIEDYPWIEDEKEYEVLFNPLRVVQSTYDKFEKIILGDDIVSTWMDDTGEGGDIMAYITNKRIDLVPTAVQPHPEFKGYMTKEHYKIYGMDIVFMTGQPDNLWFKKSDIETLLEKATQSKINELTFTLEDMVNFAEWCTISGITDKVTPSDVNKWLDQKKSNNQYEKSE